MKTSMSIQRSVESAVITPGVVDPILGDQYSIPTIPLRRFFHHKHFFYHGLFDLIRRTPVEQVVSATRGFVL